MMKQKSILAFLALLALTPFITLLEEVQETTIRARQQRAPIPILNSCARPPTRAEQAASAASLKFDARMEALARPLNRMWRTSRRVTLSASRRARA